MRYLFHVVGRGRRYEDRIGERFSSPEKAAAHAVTIANELASSDDGYLGLEVQVMDCSAREWARVPICAEPADLAPGTGRRLH